MSEQSGERKEKCGEKRRRRFVYLKRKERRENKKKKNDKTTSFILSTPRHGELNPVFSTLFLSFSLLQSNFGWSQKWGKKLQTPSSLAFTVSSSTRVDKRTYSIPLSFPSTELPSPQVDMSLNITTSNNPFNILTQYTVLNSSQEIKNKSTKATSF